MSKEIVKYVLKQKQFLEGVGVGPVGEMCFEQCQTYTGVDPHAGLWRLCAI